MVRVLMTTDTIGGVWTYALELSRELEANGVEVALATMGRPLSKSQRHAAVRLQNVQVFESSYRLEWMLGENSSCEEPWSDVKEAGEWLQRLESDVYPDVIHLNGYAHGQLSWNAPTLLVGHSDVVSWFRHVKGQRPPVAWDRYRREVKAGLLTASSLIAPTHASARDLKESYDLERQIRVIPNGRTFSRDNAKKEPFILAVGRLWDEAKNISALINISSRLDMPIQVIGDAGGCDFEGVNVLGELSSTEVEGYFSRASIYALPARYEPFGLSILEAAMSGCALVLGDIPSLRENWQSAAIFVDPDNSEQLKEALQVLAHDRILRERLGAQARERSRSFEARFMADAYFNEYCRLMRPELPLSQDQHLARGA